VNIKLARYVQQHQQDYEKIFFVTYLYLPTIWGVLAARGKSVLIPLAHDEAAFHFLICQKILDLAPAIITNTLSERNLVLSKIGDPDKVKIAGLGLAPIHKPKELLLGLSQKPYLLYLGRLSNGKKVDVLISHFIAYDRLKNLGHHLVLAGHKDPGFFLPEHPRISYLGFINDEKKNALLHEAACVINPSPLESLSLIVLEAIDREKPVLVNKECSVLNDYVQTCDSVSGYLREDEFIHQLEAIMITDWQQPSQQLKLTQAKKWAHGFYSWEHIFEVYKNVTSQQR
jgi:glycosyltransferase involved in cell wall biosynthesis